MAELPCDVVASASLDDRISPKTTPCTSRTDVIPTTKAVAVRLPELDCNSRTAMTICIGTSALPMINGTRVLHTLVTLAASGRSLRPCRRSNQPSHGPAPS